MLWDIKYYNLEVRTMPNKSLIIKKYKIKLSFFNKYYKAY